ncbi:MAG: 4-diphosphocytidyl-2C-methyl-D-erythritol synthase [Nitrospira sp.]|nr:MAG: 4-diphosphocytidyl-2C-methyl-D-erythritol synthase [Nitrospira sp.]
MQEERDAASVAVIILAAGASTRMGKPKQLLTYGGHTFLRNAAEVALASMCRPIAVVLGAHADLLKRGIDDLPVQQVMNTQWAKGMSASIQAGLQALEEGDREGTTKAVVLMLCDQPFVTAAVINELVRTARSTGKGIVASEYGGTIGVPALFRREYFPELAALSGDGGAKRIIAAHPGDVAGLLFPQGTTDIDTPEDYSHLQLATHE